MKKDEKRAITLVDLNASMEESTKRLEELRAGRVEHDIPLTDEYWKALRKHRDSYMKGNYGK